ncbi:hypothetical protein [Desulfobacter latus]|uniref:Uncharacterized protein n=1 Tax=Desulfobacter latus TaxID=2292 RepID=A0A850TBN0_9BACT|nr:hypothetical protein [Desulfobacter latus]NWH06845.1 hypothetical protein [Desulfobacter latus]
MERKSLPSLLESKREYTYEEAFRIYDEAGRAACAEENRKIAQQNAKRQEEVNNRNKDRESQAQEKNAQAESEARMLNSKAKKARLIKVAIISFIIALVLSITAEEGSVFLIVLPISFIILMFIIKPKYHWANHEEAEKEELSEIASKNYTFLPSGTIQCSSCGTKTKIDTKDATSTCPNCRSEIFVISNMEDNVTVKTMARSKT